jgi:type VI secretion system protein VasG
MAISLKALISKLNDETRAALTGAAALCGSRGHGEVEIEHYLAKLAEPSDNDMAMIARFFDMDLQRLANEINRALDKIKRGSRGTPTLAADLVEMLTEAWTLGSLNHGAGQIRTGFTVLALMTKPELARLVRDLLPEIRKINAESLAASFETIVGGSAEVALAAASSSTPGGDPQPGVPNPNSKTPGLDQFTVDLTANARAGKIDPVLARDPEIRRSSTSSRDAGRTIPSWSGGRRRQDRRRRRLRAARRSG